MIYCLSQRPSGPSLEPEQAQGPGPRVQGPGPRGLGPVSGPWFWALNSGSGDLGPLGSNLLSTFICILYYLIYNLTPVLKVVHV